MVRRITALISYFLLGYSLVAQEYDQAIAKARFLIQEHQKQTNIPGLQVAVMIDGEMIWSESMGYADLENAVPVTSKTQFRTASLAKPLTSIALGNLLEDNLISLDNTVEDFLPDYPAPAKEITVRQLAGSISGIRHYNDADPKFRTKNYKTVQEAVTIFRDDPLDFEPGTEYGYSSYGWVLLSALMEKAAGVSFEKIMNDSWDQLGIENTSFDSPNHDSEDISKFYIKGRKRRELAPFQNRSFMYAGGGYLSTSEDLVRIGHQFINFDFLKKSTVDTLTKSLHLKNGALTYYGLGWELGSSKIDTEVWHHNGSMPTARTHWLLLPEQKIVLAYMSNTGEHVFFNDAEAHAIAQIFLDAKRAKAGVNINSEYLTREWTGKVTSLYGKSKKAKLTLESTKNGLVIGEIAFKRSRKREVYPVVVKSSTKDSLHLIAVTPMFADFHLRIDSNDNLEGEWQHDFVRKPNEDEDEFWKQRKASFRKIQD
ncbi:serine hydrolase domain-containing protein [Marivirga harenae]|uniref:serine hydrolase domain-containing protein n=1 Tax=Marivirga harenae TaxID=2010992 RepID=UPI0026E10E83|nr:serine hydrolase domain-containing protein [Marivirga harenae]WKV14091.1 serine hydrolase domain-containing protein [Marivirga harenae]|tara:strand:+ start:119723 stop:121174 length:1452 start_codon:yes stop_codon:yes gene_type:complete